MIRAIYVTVRQTGSGLELEVDAPFDPISGLPSPPLVEMYIRSYTTFPGPMEPVPEEPGEYEVVWRRSGVGITGLGFERVS